ncbi:hypothetical protein D3C87_1446530 [compost metagenome]
MPIDIQFAGTAQFVDKAGRQIAGSGQRGIERRSQDPGFIDEGLHQSFDAGIGQRLLHLRHCLRFALPNPQCLRQ